jgi:hypothetical protein
MPIKYILYIIGGFILLAAGYYFLGEMGLLGAAGILFGSTATKLKQQSSTLDTQAAIIKEKIQEIEKKEVEIKQVGVEDKSAQEEVNYWKNQ